MRLCWTLLLIFIEGMASKSIANQKGQKEPSKSIEAFDQRQSGKYNFVFNLKDVQMVKLDGFKVGDDYNYYGDYADYPESDYDYSDSNLTTSPIWAFLTDKPPSTTTKKPKPTTEKSEPETSSSKSPETSTATATVTQKPETTTVIPPKPETVDKLTTENPTKVEESLNESEDKPVLNSKPASIKTTTTSSKIVTESIGIDYEEIPVQVVYERRKNSNYNNQQQQRVKGTNGRRRYHKKKPAIEIIDPVNLKHHRNVEVIDSAELKSDPGVVVMCAHNEYVDNLGRCRTKRFKNKQGL
jgi:hypothetical protein